jgi:prevent-host-death family protein
MKDDHMKRAATKPAPEVGAAEFKAKCLGLIDDIHARKRNFVIITKRGKPYAKLVPVDSKDEPLYGCMKGLARINGDVTKPVDVEWEALK